MLRILFHVDGSKEIGLGHIRRCEALVGALHAASPTEVFVGTRYPESEALDGLRTSGVEVLRLSEENLDSSLLDAVNTTSPDRIVIDSLFPYSQETIQRANAEAPVIMLHPVGSGRFDAHTVIYPNAHMSDDFLGDPRWREHQVRLVEGWQYVLINPAAVAAAPARPQYPPRTVGVVAGGSDPGGLLASIAEALPEDAGVEFIRFFTGAIAETPAELRRLAARRTNWVIQPFDLDRIVECDLAVTAFGVTTYELVYKGIPTITVAGTTRHAEASAEFARRNGITVPVGQLTNRGKQKLRSVFLRWVGGDDYGTFRKNVEARRLIDGKAADRCARLIVDC